MLIWGLVTATAALIAFGAGFLVASSRRRHQVWSLAISALVLLPLLAIMARLGMLAATTPNCHGDFDRCALGRWGGFMFAALVVGVPTVSALASYWAGVTLGRMLHSRRGQTA